MIVTASMDAPLVTRPKFFAQNFLEDFPRPAFRQGVNKFNGFGNFESRQMLSTMIQDFGFARLAARLQRNDGLGDFSPLLVGNGDNRAFQDGGVLVKDALNFRRGHVLAARSGSCPWRDRQ